MAVAVDNTGTSVGGTALTSKTITAFAIGAGANRLLFVGVSQFAITDQAPSGNFNTSETLTAHDSATVVEGSGTRRVAILYRVAPSNATADIVINWGGTVDEAVVGATSWTGADQTTPLGTAVKNTGVTGTTSTVTISNASGDAVHDTISADGSAAVSATPNQTQRWRQLAASATTEGAGQSAAGAGSNIACTWTQLNGNSNGFFAHIGVAIAQAVTGAITFRSSTGGTIATAASTWSFNSSGLGLVTGGALIVGFGLGSTTVSVSTVTDNAGNVFLKAIANGANLPTAARCELWYANGITATSTRVSVTLSGASSGSMGLFHATGISTGTPLDVTGSSAVTALSTSHSASQITPTSANALVVSYAYMNASTIGTVTTLGGMTRWLSTNLAVRTVGQYIIQGAASTCTGSFTTSSQAMHASVIAAFNDTNAVAVGGGGGRHRYWSFTFTGVQSAHV